MGVNLQNLSWLLVALLLALSWIASSRAENDAAFPMPSGKQYVEECGSCHTAYAPGLLPARSWRKTMEGLSDHFGEDAELDPEAHAAILSSLLALAADSGQANMLMRRIATAIPAAETPLRASTGPFFRYMHDEVPASIWKRAKIGNPSNCIACHTRANLGRYGEGEVRIPK
jgi:cytochrome c553